MASGLATATPAVHDFWFRPLPTSITTVGPDRQGFRRGLDLCSAPATRNGANCPPAETRTH